MVLQKLVKWLSLTDLVTQQLSIQKDEALAKRFGTEIKAMRIIWNSPSTFGGIGDVYNAFYPIIDTWMWFIRTQLCW